MDPITVLIADDQELVRTGFRMILNTQTDISVVGEAADGREAVELATELRPDVVLMDVRMPKLDGIAATRRIVEGAIDGRPKVVTRRDLRRGHALRQRGTRRGVPPF